MKKAGDILHSILRAQDAETARNWSSFFRGWETVAGEDLAAHSVVQDVKNGAVYVEVDHPGWLQMLQLKKSKILKDVKAKYPELGIVDIRCFVTSGQAGTQMPDRTTGVRGVVSEQSPETGSRPQEAPAGPDESSEEYQEFKALLERLRERGDE